jgi:tetratricopeptide (TPR) repeat protein
MVAPFVPKFKEAVKEKDKVISAVVTTLAHTFSIHNAATYLLENEAWDFMAVYWDSIDHFSHATMKYHPPKLPTITEEKFDRYKEVITGAYRFHDMMLDRILSMIDKDTTVIIVSDHGFHSDHLRPRQLPKEPAGPTYEHSPYAFFAIRGPGIKKNHTIFGGSVIDITPTLLSLYEKPIGRDMEGKPLIQIYEEAVELSYVDSWESIEGKSGMHNGEELDPWAQQEAMQQLIDLGYIDAPTGDKAHNIRQAKNESLYYVARNIIDGGRRMEALPMLEQLVADNIDRKENVRYGYRLLGLYLSLGLNQKAFDLLQKMKSLSSEDDQPFLIYHEASFHLANNNPVRAEELFRKVIEIVPNSANMYRKIGLAYLHRQKYKEAEAHFDRAIEIDPDNIFARNGLATVYLKNKRYEDAVDQWIQTISNTYYYIPAHQGIGMSLYGLGMLDKAAEAFEVAAAIGPKLAKTRRWLVRIYDELGNEEKKQFHEKILNDHIRGHITLVSGPARSGMSLVMQILEKGGYPVKYDAMRPADEFNPLGYYELTDMQRLPNENSFLKGLSGSAVKIPLHYLKYLPDNYDYKLILLERNTADVMRSQQKIKSGGKFNPENAFNLMDAVDLTQHTKEVEELLNRNPHIQVLKVSYEGLLSGAESEMESLAYFMGEEFDLASAVNSSDPDLAKN